MTHSDSSLILGYHAVSASWDSQLAVSVSDLRTQLTHLKRRGYVGLTVSELERRRGDGTLPPRSLAVTFDDGYASTFRACPVLEELGFPGTVFVVTRFVDSGELLQWKGIDHWLEGDDAGELRSLSWRDAEELVARGWEVGSHTVTHPVLTLADDAALERELVESRQTIERRLGRCTSVAYPYGVADVRVADVARRAGYEVGHMLTLVHGIDEPMRRPRIGMGPGSSRLATTIRFSRLALSARRTRAARLARGLRRRRTWLPDA